MKTIKAIKESKNVELGKIKRVGEKEADSEVRSKYWAYVPKSEWKTLTRKPKTQNDPTNENLPTEETKKQTKTKKNVKKSSK